MGVMRPLDWKIAASPPRRTLRVSASARTVHRLFRDDSLRGSAVFYSRLREAIAASISIVVSEVGLALPRFGAARGPGGRQDLGQ